MGGKAEAREHLGVATRPRAQPRLGGAEGHRNCQKSGVSRGERGRQPGLNKNKSAASDAPPQLSSAPALSTAPAAHSPVSRLGTPSPACEAPIVCAEQLSQHTMETLSSPGTKTSPAWEGPSPSLGQHPAQVPLLSGACLGGDRPQHQNRARGQSQYSDTHSKMKSQSQPASLCR